MPHPGLRPEEGASQLELEIQKKRIHSIKSKIHSALSNEVIIRIHSALSNEVIILKKLAISTIFCQCRFYKRLNTKPYFQGNIRYFKCQNL